MKQTTFADAEYAGKRKQTRRERFLIEMCAFHAIRPPSPPTSGHLFHAHPAGQSERSDAGLHC